MSKPGSRAENGAGEAGLSGVIWPMRRRLTVFSAALLAGALAAWFGAPWLAPLPPALLAAQSVSTRFLAADGTPLRMLLTEEGQRVAGTASYADIPEHLRNAVLAAEDKRFFQHGGVDLLAIARSAWDNLRAGRVVSGASTLHQQLIKITAARPGPRTLGVKLVEALQARRLAMTWSKEEVLAAWLNRVSYGNLLTGCESAALGYFDKPLPDLSPAECALLAAIPQSPARLNPFRGIERARPRQTRILEKMRALGWLDAGQLQTALAEPVRLRRFNGGFEAPHAVQMLAGGTAPDPVVLTTLDAALQRAVERVITERLSGLRERQVTQAAVVVIENATGHILALAGSRDFSAPDGGQINGAWTPRSPGSAVKPFTYLLAFERGAAPASIVADLPVEYSTGSGSYLPENYTLKHYGPMTYRAALGNSLNVSAVKVLQSAGGPGALLRRLRQLGLTTLTESAEHYGPGLTIGNAPVRLVELANAYACLARLGIHKPWSLLPRENEGARLLDGTFCYLIADILADNSARALTFGQNSVLRLPFPAAVKTGTSSTYRDNWTLGFTREFTVGVWAGNFDNRPMQDVSGVTGAAPIWRDVMLELQRRRGVSWHEPPPGLVKAVIDPRTGRRLTPQSPPARVSREDWFPPQRLPPPAGAEDYDAQGRAILPGIYADWVAGADNWMGDLVVCETAKKEKRPWQITSPAPGTVIHLDPDLPGSGARLLLQANQQGVRWDCGTLEIVDDAGRPVALLKPGRHTLRAEDPATGETRRTFVIVHPE
ncbi:MAG TPA: penicillin-binding protein 1C [Verrucomicrobiales bacterium]|nr:penicillin-binding protein 1C [Verrucomicrobiales bacterium]